MMIWGEKRERLEAMLRKALAEAETLLEHNQNFTNQIELLQAKLKAADVLNRVHEERALILRETIDTLKEQNRALLDTLRGPDVYNGDPLASARRNLALAEADEEPEADKDENGYTLGERLNQYEDPHYVPVSIREKIRAAAALAREQAEAVEELET